MALGIHIKLGTEVDDELDGASVVDVHERMGEPTTYTLRYEIDMGDGDLPALIDPKRDAGSELAVVATIDDAEQVLVQGPVRGQRIRLAHGGGGSWLEVAGADRSIEMDREVKARVFASGTASDAVTSILADDYGFETEVDDTSAQYGDDTHALVQRDTDLRFVRRLARRYGFLFWMSTEPDGTHTGHFRRPPVDDDPAFAMQINIAPSSIDALDLQFDIERATSATAIQLDLLDKQPLDGSAGASPLTALGTTPLAVIATGTRALRLGPPVDDVADLLQRAEGALIEEGWFLRGAFEARPEVLKHLVRAHTILQIDGAGSRHSGKYLVAAVHHHITSSSHQMQVELVRNAWGAA